jgi:hypothetical protein
VLLSVAEYLGKSLKPVWRFALLIVLLDVVANVLRFGYISDVVQEPRPCRRFLCVVVCVCTFTILVSFESLVFAIDPSG